MLELILPTEVETHECFGQPPGGPLFPEEQQIIAHAVETRQREYATVRSCARACLKRLGHPQVPILPGYGGAPTWPAGIWGSMTHCAGYAAAAVSHHQRIFAIGIDAEPDAPLPDGVLDLIATAAEQDRLPMTQTEPDSPNFDRLLFSAKESVYKTWFPLVGEWLDHHQVEILLNPHNQTFKAQLSRNGLTVGGRHIRHLHGRWTRTQGILATAVVVTSM